jgi:hypothetical protein
MKKILFYFLTLAAFVFASCSSKENLAIITADELSPMQVGKVFIYRLDSTVNFNQSLVVHSYIAKDSIESKFNDGSGRTSFRIFRYLTDTLQTKPWQYTATYYSTTDNNTIEYIDNNLRFVSLVSPVRAGVQWKGTQYINSISPSPFSYFSNWNFEYQNADEPFLTKKGIIQNTYTIFQQDETLPDIPIIKKKVFRKKFMQKALA